MKTIKVEELVRLSGLELLGKLDELLKEDIKFNSIRDYKEVTVSLRKSHNKQAKDLLNIINKSDRYLPEGVEIMVERCPVCGSLTIKKHGDKIAHCTCCNVILAPYGKWEYEYAYNEDELTWCLLFGDSTIENEYSLKYLIKWLKEGIPISRVKPIIGYKHIFRDAYMNDTIINNNMSEYSKIEKTLGMIIVMSNDNNLKDLSLEALTLLRQTPSGTSHYLDINDVILAEDIREMKKRKGLNSIKREEFKQFLRYKSMVNDLYKEVK